MTLECALAEAHRIVDQPPRKAVSDRLMKFRLNEHAIGQLGEPSEARLGVRLDDPVTKRRAYDQIGGRIMVASSGVHFASIISTNRSNK